MLAAVVRHHVYLPGRLAPSSMAVLLMCFELQRHIETRFTGGPPSSDFNEHARNLHYAVMEEDEVADRSQPSKDVSYSNNRQDVCGRTRRN